MTGVSNDTDFGKRISGSTSFHLSIAVKPDRLAFLCGKLLEKFLDVTYKERFPWVDHISEVRNKTIVLELDSLLLKMLQERNFEQIFLSVPEIIDWEQVHGFKYADMDKEVREDISIEDVLPTGDEIIKVNLAWLERKQVLCIGANNDDVVNRWTLYKCLNCELKKGNEAFLLTGGKWFKIDTAYVKTVSEEIAQIPEYANFSLPKSKGEKEAEYNKMAADSDTSRCVLMDKKLIPYGGGHNKIELCDLFVDKHDFIHVKRFRGSACLSHLFQQGHNAAFLLRAEMDFLKKANQQLPVGWKFDENKSINPSEYEVVFAVISKVKKQVRDVFPFFSKVSLQQVYKQLKVYGYKVSIAKIEMQ